MQETGVSSMENIQGWFWIEGSVQAFLRSQWPAKHRHLLPEAITDLEADGVAIAWAAGKASSPPINSGIHLPFWSKKVVPGLTVAATISWLSRMLAEAERETSDDVEKAKIGSSVSSTDPIAVDDETPMDDAPAEDVGGSADYYGDSTFSNGKYVGKYSDSGEGRGVAF